MIKTWERRRRSREEIERAAREILEKMTLEQKINQMSGDLTDADTEMERMATEGYNVRPYYAGRDDGLGIPPMAFTDGPRGIVMGQATCFPVSMARAASWDPNLEEKIADAMGKEARALGANYYGGVCINLVRHPAWGRAQESFGEDPFILGEFGAAQVRGIQKNNVIACAKHYAGNSMENARFKVNVKMDERTLREVYLPHFKKCIQEGAGSVMNAYNKLRGEHCGHNAYLLRQILKEEWGFEGYVITDFVFGIRDGKKGIEGGVDVEMPFTIHYGEKLQKLVEDGEVPVALINEAVLRILRQKLRFFANVDSQDYDPSLVACDEHIQLARESAAKSMVLVKNEKQMLPLRKDRIKKLAVVGSLGDTPNTGDRGSSNVRNRYTVTPLAGIKNLVGDEIEVLYSDGQDLEDVAKTSAAADVVVIVTGNRTGEEGEFMEVFGDGGNGGDRDTLTIVDDELLLLNTAAEANENCIVVLQGGSAIMIEEWKDSVSAILISWYSGMEGGNALADILFGNVNPSGKLPITIPANVSQLPFFNKDAEEIEYGYYHGYTLCDKKGYTPAFAFGYGLSYTDYQYKDLQVKVEKERLKATVKVSNIGSVAGEEIVQLYVGFENSRIERPVKLLKGFTRVQLAPNETETVTISVDLDELAYYNPDKSSWQIESMEYNVHVGRSSRKEDLLTQKAYIEA